MVSTDSATRRGSSRSKSAGLPVSIWQKSQRRVHWSPPMRKVASRSSQHSKMFGQPASWHTVCSPSDFTSFCSAWYSGPILARVLIHSGLRSIGVSALRTSSLSSFRPSGAMVTTPRVRATVQRCFTRTLMRMWTRPGPTAREQRYDVLLGLGMAAAGVFGTELARGGSPQHVSLGIGGVEPYVLSAAVALPLCFRRRWPIPVVLAVAVLFVVNGERALFSFQGNLVTQSTMFMAIYAAVAWAKDRRLMKAVVGLVFIGMFGWLTINFVKAVQANAIDGPNHGLFSPYVSNVIIGVALNVLYFFGAYFWGRTAWATARQRYELERQ